MTYSGHWSALEDRELINFIERYPCADERKLVVLDLGCGTGFGYRVLQTVGIEFEYTGLDFSREMLSTLQSRYPASASICCSISETSKWPRKDMDIVLSLNGTFSFCLRPKKTLKQIVSSIRAKNGIAIIGVLNARSLRRLAHLKRGCLESYSSRGRPRRSGSVPALVYPWGKFEEIAQAAGLKVIGRLHQGVLSGVLEVAWLWPASLALGRRAPFLSHCSYYCCVSD